jgi:hypothetical protein
MRFEDSPFGKKSNGEGYSGNGDKLSDKPVEYINEKWDPVMVEGNPFIYDTPYNLDEQQ